MSVNDILRRTLACYRGIQSKPALKPLMRPDLFATLEALSKKIEKVLPAAATPGVQNAAPDPTEEAYAATRSALSRLQHCARGWYADDEEALRALGELTLGDDPAQDVMRLQLLVGDLAKLKSPLAFVFPPDLLPARVKELIAAHHAAGDKVARTSEQDQTVHKSQIALRAPAHALWRKDGLDAWVQASVPDYEEQVALGRERRRRSRKPPATGAGEKKDGKTAPDKGSDAAQGAKNAPAAPLTDA